MKLNLLFSIVACITVLLITGCSKSNVLTNSLNFGETDPVKPPDLIVYVGEDTVKPSLNAYSWGKDNNGKITSIQAASFSPPELAKNQEPVYVMSDEEIVLEFETQPDKYSVRTWDADYNPIGTFDEISLSAKGKVIYEIEAHWEGGIANYAFALNIE